MRQSDNEAVLAGWAPPLPPGLESLAPTKYCTAESIQVQASTLQYTAVHCSVVYDSTVQCSAVEFDAVQLAEGRLAGSK